MTTMPLSGRVSPPDERVSVHHGDLCRLLCEATRFALLTGDKALVAALGAVLADIIVLPPATVEYADANAGDVPEAEL